MTLNPAPLTGQCDQQRPDDAATLYLWRSVETCRVLDKNHNPETMKGVYVLIMELEKDTIIRVGKLGKFSFEKGYYAYTGSALGTGGFKRVTRHFNISSGKNMTRKWHIDHLLSDSKVIVAVLIPTNKNIECNVAEAISDFCTGIPGFGCSDCSCSTHLFYSGYELTDRVVSACRNVSGIESIITRPDI